MTATKTKPVKKEATEQEKAKAKSLELNVTHYRLLVCLSKASKPLTYRDIEAKTGYYNALTADLREEKDGSLGSRGLVKEQIDKETGKVAFIITAKGKKLLAKLSK